MDLWGRCFASCRVQQVNSPLPKQRSRELENSNVFWRRRAPMTKMLLPTMQSIVLLLIWVCWLFWACRMVFNRAHALQAVSADGASGVLLLAVPQHFLQPV